MIKIGVIGYGYWGPNLVRNFQQCDATSVTCVCDIHTSVLDRVKAAHPGVDGTVWTEELINSKDVDAVVIATPVSTHFDLALDALKAGKHVFVEKPMTQTAAQSEQLIEEAEKRNLTLMVDHTFIYTGPVRKIRELVTGEKCRMKCRSKKWERSMPWVAILSGLTTEHRGAARHGTEQEYRAGT